jgi:leucyl aminopeptidase
MTELNIKVAQKVPAFSEKRVYAVGLSSSSGKVMALGAQTDVSSIASLNLENFGATATRERIIRIPGPSGSVFALVGTGGKILDSDSLRSIAGAIARELSSFSEVVLDLPHNSKSELYALVEGYSLGAYRFDSYLSSSKKPALKKQTVSFISSLRLSSSDLEAIAVTAEAVKFTRDLVNTPANDLYPESMTKHALKHIKGLPLSVDVLDEKRLKSGGFGGLVAVGSGSSRPPRLVKISYTPKGAKRHLALVGKGITFDTGGLSLKPAEAMVGMKYDMTGAASVLTTLAAVAKLGLKVRVTGWLCLAENMPSGTAQRPNDIIKVRNGKTIEVLNTDAEGRLVLADGLSAASEEKPDLIVDVATLTGAAVIALGDRYAGLMGDESATAQVAAAANATGELVWAMPLPEELRPLLNSDIADIANVKIGNRAGGMLVGGHFLREFIGESKLKGVTIPWAHIDIAGPSDNSGSAYGFTPKGATGNIVRTLIELARLNQK